MSKDRPHQADRIGVSNQQRLELQCTYLKALEEAIPSMTSAEAQAQLVNPGVITKVIRGIKLPLVLRKTIVAINTAEAEKMLKDSEHKHLDLDIIRERGGLLNAQWRRDLSRSPTRSIKILRLTEGRNVSEVAKTVQSIGLELGSLVDFVYAINNVVPISELACYDVVVTNPNWDFGYMYYGVRLLAGQKKVERYTWSASEPICADIRKTIIIGVGYTKEALLS